MYIDMRGFIYCIICTVFDEFDTTLRLPPFYKIKPIDDRRIDAFIYYNETVFSAEMEPEVTEWN